MRSQKKCWEALSKNQSKQTHQNEINIHHHQQLKSNGRENPLLTSVGRIMVKANQLSTADVCIYFSPPAQKTLPVALKAVSENTDVYFIKSKSLTVWMLVGSVWGKHWTNDPPLCVQLHNSGGIGEHNMHGKRNKLKTTVLTAANGTDLLQIIFILYC